MYSSDKEITLTLKESELYFGMTLNFQILYKNRGESSIEFFQPDKSSVVFFRIRGVGNNYKRGISLSKPIVYFENGITEYMADEGEMITLNPGEIYVIDYPLNDLKSDYFKMVGNYYVYIYDGIEKVKYNSNKLEISLPFRDRSVLRIVELLNNESIVYIFKDYLATLLLALNSDFKYISERRITDEQRLQNETQLEQFKIWWEQNKGTEEIAEKIKEINRKAGFEVE